MDFLFWELSSFGKFFSFSFFFVCVATVRPSLERALVGVPEESRRAASVIGNLLR